jgi:hypothetical protein
MYVGMTSMFGLLRRLQSPDYFPQEEQWNWKYWRFASFEKKKNHQLKKETP